LQGEAEAYAIEVKAKAEAEQMAKKADAWKEYKEAALVDMMLQVGASIWDRFSLGSQANKSIRSQKRFRIWPSRCNMKSNTKIMKIMGFNCELFSLGVRAL
jgi:hypothetical protein